VIVGLRLLVLRKRYVGQLAMQTGPDANTQFTAYGICKIIIASNYSALACPSRQTRGAGAESLDRQRKPRCWCSRECRGGRSESAEADARRKKPILEYCTTHASSWATMMLQALCHSSKSFSATVHV